MASYVDYTYYTTQYLGSAIAEASFPSLALQASAFVDLITFDRAAPVIEADTDAETVTRIKNAVCSVAEEMQRIQKAGGLDGIASESIGNYSVTFADSSEKRLTNDKRLVNAAGLWLANTGLMYAGVSA